MCLVLYCLRRLVIPESPRWLAVNGKYEEVMRLLKKICKINGRKLPDGFDPAVLADKVNYLHLCSIATDGHADPTWPWWVLGTAEGWVEVSLQTPHRTRRCTVYCALFNQCSILLEKCVCQLHIAYVYLASEGFAQTPHRGSAPGPPGYFGHPVLICPPYLQTLAIR